MKSEKKRREIYINDWMTLVFNGYWRKSNYSCKFPPNSFFPPVGGMTFPSVHGGIIYFHRDDTFKEHMSFSLTGMPWRHVRMKYSYIHYAWKITEEGWGRGEGRVDRLTGGIHNQLSLRWWDAAPFRRLSNFEKEDIDDMSDEINSNLVFIENLNKALKLKLFWRRYLLSSSISTLGRTLFVSSSPLLYFKSLLILSWFSSVTLL